jgi:hypothetical protein
VLEAMQRRTFLKLAGLIAAGPALQTVTLVREHASGLKPGLPERYASSVAGRPAAWLSIQQPGTYRISGLVRLEAPLVEISGFSNRQSISWADRHGSEPVASFVTFERFERPGTGPGIHVRGGQLQSLAVVPVD